MKTYIPIIFICAFLCFSKKGYSQALPIYSQYMFNEYLINAAFAGTYDFTPIIINHRSQWVGFGDSTPKTSSISAHSPFGDNGSLGGLMVYDKTSPISRTQLEATYGYHTMIGPNKNFILSMALSGTWNMLQYTYEPNMTYSEMMDGSIDNINQGNENSSAPDLNFGVLLLNDYFDIGLSVRNLFAPEATNSTENNSLERVKYVILHGSYLGKNNPRNAIGIIPSFVIRKMGLISYNSLFQLDLNFKIIYVNKVWAGMTYRTHEKAICTLLGVNTGYGFFGWSYDIGTSELGSYHNGSHNIAIGLNLQGKNKRIIRNQNPFNLNIDNEWRRIQSPFNKKHKTGR
tara:strand:+ start:1237 stop:2268 length:1032 start_codon:yes stop_codon:yes gene_type:complete